MKPLILEYPRCQTSRQRRVYGAITLVFWMGWFYLWLPLLSFFAWLFGISKFQYHMIALEGYRGLLQLFLIYFIVVVIMGGSLVLWAFYNYFRFRGVEKRRHRAPLEMDQQAHYFGLSPQELAAWRTANCLVVIHDEKCGEIVGVLSSCKPWFREHAIHNGRSGAMHGSILPLPHHLKEDDPGGHRGVE